jgi:DNA repair protein RecO (recombination protein O)
MITRERIRRVEAIVIGHSNYGEADRILTLFTREMGKLRAMAKGVRKEHSRKAGHLEPFTCSILMLARGTSFWIISQAETVLTFDAIRADLDKMALAAYCLELVERFTAEEEDHQVLYRLLKDTLKRLAEVDEPFNVIRHFELNFLERVGFRPELFHCVQCRAEIKPEDQYISIPLGGVLCPACGGHVDAKEPIDLTTLKYLRHFQRSGYEEISRLTVPLGIQRKMERFLQRYITSLAERKLNTPAFYRAIHPAFAADKLSGGRDDTMDQGEKTDQ